MSHGEAHNRTVAFPYPVGTQVFAAVLTGQTQHSSLTILKITVLPQVRYHKN